jgi:arylsulfatase A-like enzyme/Tfp pilus assembly protein PilF
MGAGRSPFRRTAWVGLVAFVTSAAAAGGWWVWRRSDVHAGRANLGPLPGGIRPADLNVVLITLDTTRFDAIGSQGARAAATPALDRLAAEGVQFDQAVSAAPLTLPAHATIFTSQLPPVHGVRDNGGYVLDSRHTTLAETLQQKGWQTAAFVGAFVLDSKWGLDQGFERYVDDFDLSKYQTISLGDVSRSGEQVADRALSWLSEPGRGRFFAWVHFYDPHAPYEPSEPYRSRYADRPYLGEIAYVDAQVDRLLRWLDTSGLARRTVVVAMGDHGEGLGDHQEGAHGFFVYDSTVRIPLIIRAPFERIPGRRVHAVVRSEDVMPTVLAMVGLPPPAAVRGRSLLPLMTGEASDLDLDAYSESFYARYHYGWSALQSLRAGRYKLIAAPRPELYDLQTDPHETRNLYEERRALADRLGVELRRVAAQAAELPPAPLDPDTRERLAALGYIGTFRGTRADSEAALADPKDKVALFNQLLAAQQQAADPAKPSSIAGLTAIIEQDGTIPDAWLMLGNAHFKRHELDRAVTAYRRALALKADYDLATINLANAYRQMGQIEAAVAGYERYLEMDPRNPYVCYYLGELYTEMGALDRADASFRRALEIDPGMAAAMNALGVVAIARGDLALARRTIASALELAPDVRLAHFNLGLIHEAGGDPAAARNEYLAEIRLHPSSYKAWFNLGRLYEREGDRPRQVEAFRNAIAVNPSFAEGHLYLAKLYIDRTEDRDEAIRLARKGLELAPRSPQAPLAHYVLADVYSRQGQTARAAEEVRRGRLLEAQLRVQR